MMPQRVGHTPFKGHFEFSADARCASNPTLPPREAEELAKKLQGKKGRSDMGSRTPTLEEQAAELQRYYLPPNTLTPFTDMPTANVGSGEMLPPPPPSRFVTPPVGESPTNMHVFQPIAPQSIDDVASSALQSDALQEATTHCITLEQLKVESDITEHAVKSLAKRKLVYDATRKLNGDLEDELERYKKVCATIKAEVPVLQETVQLAMLEMHPLIAQYDDLVNAVIGKKQAVDGLKQTIDSLPFAHAEVEAATPLSMQDLNMDGFAHTPRYHPWPTEDVPPMETEPSPLLSVARLQSIRMKMEEFEQTKLCPWCFKPISNPGALKNHVASARCMGLNKPTKEELAAR